MADAGSGFRAGKVMTSPTSSLLVSMGSGFSAGVGICVDNGVASGNCAVSSNGVDADAIGDGIGTTGGVPGGEFLLLDFPDDVLFAFCCFLLDDALEDVVGLGDGVFITGGVPGLSMVVRMCSDCSRWIKDDGDFD